MKIVGYSGAVMLKLDVSYKHFQFYAQGMVTSYVINTQVVDRLGNDFEVAGREYYTGAITFGMAYTIHIKNPGRWADGVRATKARKIN